ncbi:hypothetical protein MBLNU459_g8126t2 [Dothideomycetes sp. NU459]
MASFCRTPHVRTVINRVEEREEEREQGMTKCLFRHAKRLTESGSLQNLESARLEAARKDVLRSTLRDVAYSGVGLPNELREVSAVVSTQLDGKTDASDAEIVEDEVAEFMEHIDVVAATVGEHVEQNTMALARLAGPSPAPHPPDPQTRPSFPAHHKRPTDAPTALGPALRALGAAVSTSHAALAESRTALTHSLLALLALHRALVELLIHALDRGIHGSVARGTRAQATYLGAVAEGLSKKVLLLRQQVLAAVYDEETREGLRRAAEEIEARMRTVQRRVRDREEKLRGLEAVRGLKGVVEEMWKVREEGRRVGEEVARLRRERAGMQ